MTEYINRNTNSVFEEPWWLDIVAKGKWGVASVQEGDEILARLPYVIENGRINNPVYTQTLGVWFNQSINGFAKGNAQFHYQKELIKKLLAQLPVHKCISIVLDSSNTYVLPYKWMGFDIEPTFSYRIKDLSDLEKVRLKYSKSVVKEIKKASKELIIENYSKAFDEMLYLIEQTYVLQNRKIPISKELTKDIMETSYIHSAGNLMIARDYNGVAHSGIFLLYDENVCYYLLSGRNGDYRLDGSQNLLLDCAIEFASKKSKVFDFEGSMIEGIEDFFRKFGGTIVVNYKVSKNSLGRDMFELLKPRIKKIIGYK